MSTPLFARTAVASAVTVALIGAPLASTAHAAGSTAQTVSGHPASTQSEPTAPASVTSLETSEGPEVVDTQSDDDAPSTLPAGPFAVRRATSQDTFALFDGGSRFVPDDPEFDRSDIRITLPDIDGADRAFVLVAESALDIVTEDGLGHAPYAPGANGNGDRTFAFDVADDGTIGEVTETTPDPGGEGDGDGEEEGGENGGEESPEPSPDPTEPRPTPTPAPTPTGSPDPGPEQTPEPTSDPSPGPTGDPEEDGDGGGDGDGDGTDDGDRDGDDDGGDSGSRDGPRDDDDLTEDPSTGNGSDDGGRSTSGPGGDRDWVPTAPRRPDYTDPVPQPPGADGDDPITPDSDPAAPQAGSEAGGTDDLDTDSAADEDSGTAIPWQIAVVVGIGAAAIGFILLVAGRRRAD